MERKFFLKLLQENMSLILDYDYNVIGNENTPLDELENWSSISNLELMAYINDEFNIRINAKEILSCININDVINLINKKAITTNEKR